MRRQPNDVRELAQLVAVIADRVDLTEKTACLVLVHRPSTTQELLDVSALKLPVLLHDDEYVSEVLRDAAKGFGWRRRPEQCSGHRRRAARSLRVRAEERVWSMAWRYANLHEAVFDGDIILATEHGWLDFIEERKRLARDVDQGADFEPATRPSA